MFWIPAFGFVLVSLFVPAHDVLHHDATNQQQVGGTPTLNLGTGPG